MRYLGAFISLVFAVTVWASDNIAYIEQAGQFSTISVSQDGVGNNVSGTAQPAVAIAPAYLHGDGNVVNIDQVGLSNNFGIRIITSSQARSHISLPSCFGCAPAILGNYYSYQVNGNNNKSSIDSNGDGKNTSVSNTVSVTETGDSNQTQVNVIGSFNISTDNITGNYNNTLQTTTDKSNVSYVAVSGDRNSTATTQTGVGGVAIVSTQGAMNNVQVTQQDGGANGHSANVSINGNLNTVQVSQTGLAGDSNVGIRSSGSNNSFIITSNVTR